MELLEGGTLARFIEGGEPMAEPMVTALLRPISAGLQHIHERGLVHRDIKPENIMLDDHGSPRLVDFGLAINRSRPRGDARLTSVGAVVGTPEYLSPEQVFGRPLDGRSDVFSLGVTAYELLTGRLPFDGPAIEVARQNALEDPPPMRERNPAVRVAPPLERLVFDMLERCPQHRPDAAEVARTLDRIATAAPVEAERDRASWLTVGLAAALGTAAVVLALPL
jgi:serine/threonine-protein kinase